MDEALLKSGQWPNVAEPAGSNPAEVMRKYDRKPPSVFATDEPQPQRAQFGDWVDSQADDAPISEKPAPSLKESTEDTQVLTDSREHLLDYIWREITTTLRNNGRLHDPNFWYANIVSWLDRQAAITERDAYLRGRASLDNEFAELEDEYNKHVAELCAELRECDEWRIEYKDQRDWLQERVNELTAERDILEARLAGKPECEICDRATMLVEIEGLTAERDKLQGALDIAVQNESNLEKRNGELLESRAHWIDQAVSVYRRFYPNNECAVPADVCSMVIAKIDELEAEREKVWCDCDCCGWQDEREKLTAERDRLQDVVRKQAESFKRLEIDLKRESDTCNTLRASVAGLKLTVDKLQGELDALRASGR